MFNLGWGEIVLIGIVALIAIGPKELPAVLRTLGQAMGKVRRMANEFQGQFQEALREAELADLKKQADEVTTSINDSVSDIGRYDPMAETRKDIEQSFEAPPSSAEAPAPIAAGPLPPIDVPFPELPPPLDQTDFAAAQAPLAAPETVAAKPAKKAAKKASKKAGGEA